MTGLRLLVLHLGELEVLDLVPRGSEVVVAPEIEVPGDERGLQGSVLVVQEIVPVLLVEVFSGGFLESDRRLAGLRSALGDGDRCLALVPGSDT